MIISQLKVLAAHGKQSIKDLSAVKLSESFPGVPSLQHGLSSAAREGLESLCPTGALRAEPFSIDLGLCVFCSECALRSGGHIRFTNEYRMATNVRENLVITPEHHGPVSIYAEKVDKRICCNYGKALRLREVSAGGDGSSEMELNASMNVNFDAGRFGIEFVASPRHADGIVVTGPITANMAEALELTYCAVAEPKVLVMAGTDAISGGVFAESPALDREFIERHTPDLYVPGNPVHPMTFIDGVTALMRRGKRISDGK